MAGRGLERPPLWAVIAMAVAALAIVGLSVSVAARDRAAARAVPAASSALPAISTSSAPPTAASTAATTLSKKFDLPADAHVLVIGDSYAVGTGADDPSTQGWVQVAARDLGWSVDVDAVGGTGYLSVGNGSRTFPARAASERTSASPDLIVVQGSSNDSDKLLTALPQAVATTMAELKRQFPGAPIVMVGPAPAFAEALDAPLQAAANAAGVPYIDPLAEGWLTGLNSSYIGPDGTHPTTAGHALFAKDFERDIRALSGA